MQKKVKWNREGVTWPTFRIFGLLHISGPVKLETFS